MKKQVIINSPVKKGQKILGGGGLSCFENDIFYASVSTYQIGSNDKKQHANCFTLTLRYPFSLTVLAFGKYHDEAVDIRNAAKQFRLKCKPGSTKEEHQSDPEYQKIQSDWNKLCEEVLAQAIRKEFSVLYDLLIQSEIYGRAEGRKEVQHELCNILGISSAGRVLYVPCG